MKINDIYIMKNPRQDPFAEDYNCYVRIKDILANRKNEKWVKYIFVHKNKAGDFDDGVGFVLTSTCPIDIFGDVYAPYELAKKENDDVRTVNNSIEQLEI